MAGFSAFNVFVSFEASKVMSKTTCSGSNHAGSTLKAFFHQHEVQAKSEVSFVTLISFEKSPFGGNLSRPFHQR